MKTDEVYCVCLGMKRFGGSFVESLGIALTHADPINAQKIKNTWPKYWEQYLEMGKKIFENEERNDGNRSHFQPA